MGSALARIDLKETVATRSDCRFVAAGAVRPRLLLSSELGGDVPRIAPAARRRLLCQVTSLAGGWRASRIAVKGCRCAARLRSALSGHP